MKTPLLLLGISISFLGAAQSITLSDTLSTGDATAYYVLDSNVVDLAGVTGAAVTWDYSAIGAYDMAPNNNNVINRTASAYAADFPTARYSEDFENSVKTFFTNVPGSSEVHVQGFVYIDGSNTIKIKYDDDALISQKLPMDLGDTYTDAISGSAVVAAFPAIDIDGEATVVADGTGTLKVGGNTYTDVIRVHTTEFTEGTAFGGPLEITRESYVYYDIASQNMPIFMHIFVELDAGSFGVFGFKATYGKDMITDYVGVNDILNTTAELSIYPNPVVGNIATISTEAGTQSIQILNTIGQVVLTVNNPAVLEEVNVADLKSGVYFVQATKNGTVQTSKFVVK
jgi:hypothetical protein